MVWLFEMINTSCFFFFSFVRWRLLNRKYVCDGVLFAYKMSYEIIVDDIRFQQREQNAPSCHTLTQCATVARTRLRRGNFCWWYYVRVLSTRWCIDQHRKSKPKKYFSMASFNFPFIEANARAYTYTHRENTSHSTKQHEFEIRTLRRRRQRCAHKELNKK